MRRIVMFNRVAADGYFSDRKGSLDWVVPDEEIDQAAHEGMPAVDAMLFGRRTYDMFESFWPHAEQAPSVDPHAPGRRTPALLAMAKWINETTKIVFSRTKQEVTWRNSRLIHELDPRAVEALKREPGKDMIIFGSGSVVSELTRHGLIDEYRFVVSPVLLGEGKLPISGAPGLSKLRLGEAKAFPSGNVMLRYTRSS